MFSSDLVYAIQNARDEVLIRLQKRVLTLLRLN